MPFRRRPDNEHAVSLSPRKLSPPARAHASAGRWTYDVLAAAPGLWLTLFFVIPLLVTVAVSFLHGNFGGVTAQVTPENYATALSGFYLSSFIRTLEFAALGAGLCLLVSYPVALFIARQPGRVKIWLMLAVLVPYFSSFLIRVMSWQLILARGGPLEFVLNLLHVHAGPLDILDTQTAVFIGIVYAYMPIAIVPLVLVLSRIAPEYAEASSDLGASRWATFWYITFPLSRPGIATAALLTAVPMLGELVIPMLLGGDKGVLIGASIASQYLGAQNYPVGSAMAVLVLVAAGIIVAVLARLTDGFKEVGT